MGIRAISRWLPLPCPSRTRPPRASTCHPPPELNANMCGMVIPILQMKRLRLQEENLFSQGLGISVRARIENQAVPVPCPPP